MEDIMPKNVAMWDRALRIAVGLALLALVVFGPRTQWGWLGLIPLATGLAGTCPLYRLLGISSCRATKPPDNTALSH